jgi:hypothetical protein
VTGADGGALGLSQGGVVAVGAYADFCCRRRQHFRTPNLPPAGIEQSSLT